MQREDNDIFGKDRLLRPIIHLLLMSPALRSF
jgi:hypothetical protein